MQNKPKNEQNKKAKLFEKIIFDNLYITPHLSTHCNKNY